MTNQPMNSNSGFRFDLIVVGLSVLLAALFLQLPLGLPNTPVEATADSTADWLVTRAAYDEAASPYDDIVRLADRYHTTYLAVVHPDVSSEGTVQNVHFRTPGALLLQSGMILLSPRGLWFVMGALTGAIAGFLLVMARRLGKVRPRTIRIAVIGLFFSNALIASLAYGTQSALVAGLVALGWVLTRKGDSVSGGFILALAALLKVFPLLVLVVLLKHRRKKAVASLSLAFVILNIVGMAIFSLSQSEVSLAGSIATKAWLSSTANGSIAHILNLWGMSLPVATVGSAVLAFGFVLFAMSATRTFDHSISLVLVVGVLAVPLSWAHYDLVLIPAVGYLWTQSKVHPLLLKAWLVMFLFSRFPGTGVIDIEPGSWLFAQRLVLLAAATPGLLLRNPNKLSRPTPTPTTHKIDREGSYTHPANTQRENC